MDMTKGEILPVFVRFSLPLLAGNLFQLFYSTTDILIVGNYCDTPSLAAIGASANIIFTVTGFFIGLANGAGVLVSNRYGAKDGNAVRAVFRTVLPASVLLGLVLSVFGMFISPRMLAMIAVPDEVFAKADSYLRVYFGGLLFVLLYSICAGILRSLGDSKRPLYVLVLTVVLNVGLDFLFILPAGLGLTGAAYATVISEGVSAAVVFIILLRQLARIPSGPSAGNGESGPAAIIRSVLRLGLPGAVSNSLLNFSNTFMQRYVNVFGADCMAGWAVYTRFDQLAIMPMVSISMAAMTFTAQNYGAGELGRVRKGMRTSAFLGFSIIAVVSALLVSFAPPLISLFNSEPEVIRYGALFMRASASFYVFCFGSMLFCQIPHGLGYAAVPTFITFAGFVLLRQTYLFLVTRVSASPLPVALAYPFAWPPTMLFELLYLGRCLKKREREEKNKKTY